MAVLGYPQGVATALTTLFERGQRFLVRRLGTRISASHLLAPASKGQLYHLSLRLLSTQDCHSAKKIALVSPVNSAIPFCFVPHPRVWHQAVGMLWLEASSYNQQPTVVSVHLV